MGEGILRKGTDFVLGFGFAQVGFETIVPGDDAVNVAVDGGDGFSEGDAGNGSRRVGADTRKGLEVGGRCGEMPVSFMADDLSRFVHVDGPAIVTKAFPKFQEIVKFCAGKIADGWKAGHETLVVGNYSGDPSLLQHDFRYPDGVGVFCLSPGQVAFVHVVPVQEVCGRERVR